MKYLNHLKSPLPCQWLKLATKCNKENVTDLIDIEKKLEVTYTKYDSLILKFREKPVNSSYLNQKNLLSSYYTCAPTNLVDSIIDRRHNHKLTFCPYCGDPKIPDTLDHFMPKDLFPEYSFFPNNLVPQCRGCAPIKSSQYYSDDKNIAKFIHPIYYDILDNFKFKIHVDFNKDTSEVNFSFDLLIMKKLTDEEIERIQEHINKLKISERMDEFCLKKYNFWQDKLKLKKFNIVTALELRLSELNESEKARDWESALYIGILKNKNLTNYLNSLCPNKENNEEKLELGSLSIT
ncbi:hypothetical protein V8P53_00885 [Acinetobacter baumannii]